MNTSLSVKTSITNLIELVMAPCRREIKSHHNNITMCNYTVGSIGTLVFAY